MSAWVERFTISERALHWALAVGYLLLLASGLPLMMPAACHAEPDRSSISLNG